MGRGEGAEGAGVGCGRKERGEVGSFGEGEGEEEGGLGGRNLRLGEDGWLQKTKKLFSMLISNFVFAGQNKMFFGVG